LYIAVERVRTTHDILFLYSFLLLREKGTSPGAAKKKKLDEKKKQKKAQFFVSFQFFQQ